MLSFSSDYIGGAHPEILQRMIETNGETLQGYGDDGYGDAAAEKIRAACGCPEAQVAFLMGGTQANQFVISTTLAPYEGVVAANTGHVSLHEGGAIEYTGHKVIELPQKEGKLEASVLEGYLATFMADGNREQMTWPGMVYITFPTEYGTVYTLAELEEISAICRRYELPLYLDGARLGYGLAARGGDVTLQDIARLCDVFYIGGTKMGALCGEAVVYTKHNAPKHLLTQMKQHGALIAKGRLTGVQFDALFTNDLYGRIGAYAIEKAEELKAMFREKGYRFFLDSPTNQQFIILENGQMEELAQKVAFSFWEKYDETHSVVRFAVSWSTTEADMEGLRAIL